MTPAELIFAGAALVTAITVLWKPIRKGAHLLRAIAQFTEDWNGTAERKDKAGNVIEPARAGVPALLETVRAQVQNSHATNLRDDLDVVKERLGKVEQRQDETAEKVDRVVEDVSVLRGKFAPDE